MESKCKHARCMLNELKDLKSDEKLRQSELEGRVKSLNSDVNHLRFEFDCLNSQINKYRSVILCIVMFFCALKLIDWFCLSGGSDIAIIRLI